MQITINNFSFEVDEDVINIFYSDEDGYGGNAKLTFKEWDEFVKVVEVWRSSVKSI